MPGKTKSAQLFLLLSLALALTFDFLFWRKSAGVSFPIFVILCLGVGFWLAGREGIQINAKSLWLLLPIAFFLAMSLMRLESTSLFLSSAFALLLMALLASSFVDGHWLRFGFRDFVARFALLIPAGLSTYREHSGRQKKDAGKYPVLRKLTPITRGLLLALPILWLLAALLASADQFFANWLNDLLSFLSIENLAEYLFRAFYILILTYALVAVFSYALYRSRDQKFFSKDKPLVLPFLGFGEAATILISVELLFAAFVAIQFRYFFGGGANVTEAAFTYAEYARQGFAELVVVALISVGLFLTLSALSRRKGERQRNWFSRLGLGLFALVAVMLISAYQRLLLYENAYGFTRIRTYVHAFMLWLGVLLIALVILEYLHRRRAFTLAILAAALGVAATLNLLNVDAFIVQANVERLRLGFQLDTTYLAWLSEDALPRLHKEYEIATSEGSDAIAAEVGAALACHAAVHNEYAPSEDWQSFHPSRYTARRMWQDFLANQDFHVLTISKEDDQLDLIVNLNDQEINCGYSPFWD